MNLIVRRLSVPELTQQILEMGKTGVYRESVFEALQPLATKKQIREAIAHAKQFGLQSVASLRDAELGTYYQVDLVKLQARQHLIHAVDLNEKIGSSPAAHTPPTVQWMLTIARSLAVILTIMGATCWLTGQGQLSLGLFSSGVSVAIVWVLQRTIVNFGGFGDRSG
ncbi:MAG: hypothetical protein HC769_24150 [Cyanobacteria bacterium CRU_2_1]|nr:hypothetical protein [Cyanobacteria bacterium RU_5_0]NJR61652.1 hypothetical protein [Cyanobacteria bacterium CRU_2_1]